MGMQIGDLGKAFTMWVDAAGCVTLRERGRGVDGSLPVFSVDTREEGEALQVRHCRLALDASGLYFLNDPPRTVEGLGSVSDMFRQTHAERAVEQRGAATDALRDPKVRRAALAILDRAAKVGE